MYMCLCARVCDTYRHITYTHTQIYIDTCGAKTTSNKPNSHKDAIHSLNLEITLKTLVTTATQRVVQNFPHNNLPGASITSDRKINRTRRRRKIVTVFSSPPTLVQKFGQDAVNALFMDSLYGKYFSFMVRVYLALSLNEARDKRTEIKI